MQEALYVLVGVVLGFLLSVKVHSFLLGNIVAKTVEYLKETKDEN